MFVLTTLVYPLVLALLCVGAALLVDWLSGGWLPAMLLPAVGAAALIAVAQLSTYVVPLAPATPYLLVAVAVAGCGLGRERVRGLANAARTSGSARRQLLVCPLAYALALAPVLLAGRATFSSYMALSDSAVHMLGADYLIRHGQDYSHLDLRNSYGLFVHNYYASSYPSGADTLYGGSSFVLGVPLMWTFQPFAAFMLATAAGPAWVLVRRVGLDGAWAVGATLTVVLPGLVYAYELIGSIKEIASLPLILSMGALVLSHRNWIGMASRADARAAVPFGLLVAAGVSALGVAFGAWALAAVLVVGAVALSELTLPRTGGGATSRGVIEPTHHDAGGPLTLRRAAWIFALGVLVLVVAAWPTWVKVGGSLNVANAIASTSNPGNVHTPLRASQMLGVWLNGSYLELPKGVLLTLTSVAIACVLAAALVGVAHAVRERWYALLGWLGASILVWVLLSHYATTWASAKTLMLTSPLMILMAWAGIAALRSWHMRIVGPLVALVVAPLVAGLLVSGVVVSDAMQYHASNLAPTARYEELASIDAHFAGQGPTLFEDFDEYALYELRDMDIGGPSFIYPPPALAAAGGHGKPVDLGRIAPSALAAYPLIVTRRDPSAPRPPVAYRLLWQGVYYQVWSRARGARLRERKPAGARNAQLVSVPLKRTLRPHGWRLSRKGIVMNGPGTLSATFSLSHAGAWELWLKGDVMRTLTIRIDGIALGRLGGQLDGNSLVTNPLTPLHVTLAAAHHTLTISRPGANLSPGDGGAATLAAIFLVPAIGP